MTVFADNSIPYFAWDRNWTTGQIKERLSTTDKKQRYACVSWILREAAFEDVWQFLTPRTVYELMPYISDNLGRKKIFWAYIIGKWRELGKL